MYSVLFVDDEDIEREAMAAIIPWKQMDMTLADMAWNGVEGLEKIRMNRPDVVITDIKMPVMNGIELIREAQKISPLTVFVVLSGYGEFEYTSQAMELGIRHYILKPCDETQMVEVLQKVKEELASREQKQKSEQEYQHTMRRLVPYAKGQILRELITKQELSQSDKLLMKRFLGTAENNFMLLAVQDEDQLDQLDRFVVTNILSELMGESNVIMRAEADHQIVFLIPAGLRDNIEPIVKKMHREFSKFRKAALRSAISGSGRLEEVYELYCQIQELWHLGKLEERQEFLSRESLRSGTGEVSMMVDYRKIRQAGGFEELLFEIYTSYVKMEVRDFSITEMQEAYQLMLTVLYGAEEEGILTENAPWPLVRQTVEECARRQGISMPDTNDGRRIQQILYEIYRNIRNQDLTIQYLAKEILYMNENYLGRFFYKYTGEKYSTYLQRLRMSLARRLMAYFPDIRIAELAERVGYPPDGQYFARVFKKETGMSPSEYRENVKTKAEPRQGDS